MTSSEVGTPDGSRFTVIVDPDASATADRPCESQLNCATAAPVRALRVAVARPLESKVVTVWPEGSATAVRSPCLTPVTLRSVPSGRISRLLLGSYPGRSDSDHPPSPTSVADGARVDGPAGLPVAGVQQRDRTAGDGKDHPVDLTGAGQHPQVVADIKGRVVGRSRR